MGNMLDFGGWLRQGRGFVEDGLDPGIVSKLVQLRRIKERVKYLLAPNDDILISPPR